MKNEANGLTIRATFGNIPVIDNDLFEVRAGIDASQATSTAACLAGSIEHIASDAVQDGMTPEVAIWWHSRPTSSRRCRIALMARISARRCSHEGVDEEQTG